METKPTCEIANCKFDWIMRVDGITIMFHGEEAAQYFVDLYEKRGYDVTFESEAWKRDA